MVIWNIHEKHPWFGLLHDVQMIPNVHDEYDHGSDLDDDRLAMDWRNGHLDMGMHQTWVTCAIKQIVQCI
jgi:hypothetical protein